MISSELEIFKNEEVLNPEYLPEILPHREVQIQRMANNLLPASKGKSIQNMFIFGKPGIGKTACIKFVFREFEKFSERVKTIYINTWDYNTTMAILSKIVVELGFFVQRRGISKDEVIERLIEALKKTNKSLIICLDEVDQLINKDERVLYDLLRINQYVENPVGLVFISNYRDIFVNIEPRIKSSLGVEEIEFKPYSLEEMKDILNERCKNAFKPGVVEEGVVLLCANHAVKRGGDVRVGLECLRKAARVCEEEDSDKLRVKHVKKILNEVRAVKLNLMKENLKGVEKNIIDLLSGKDKMSSLELYEKYVNEYGKMSRYGLMKHVNHLKKIGLIKTKEVRKGVRGKKFLIRLVKRKYFR